MGLIFFALFLWYFLIMFTGLVEKIGKVEKLSISKEGAKILFNCNDITLFSDVKIGDSIAINGVCLTVTGVFSPSFEAQIMRETLNITNLKNLKKGDEINLERAMKAASRFDGHIVSGHIDTVAAVESIKTDGFSKKIVFKCDNGLIVKKGSIAVNGVSLTVSNLIDDGFEVSLIPETLKNTNLKNLKIGDIVNIEYDLFAKYVQKFLKPEKESKSKVTLEFLKENGF